MVDREKVFDALRNCVTEPKCKDCPWEDCEKIGCKRVTVPVTLLLDTLKLLKNEPLPVLNVEKCGIYFGDCPHCGKRVTKKNTSYCPYCGKAVKWE